MKKLLLALAAGSIASAAFAAPASAAEPKEEKKDRKLCKLYPKTQSRIGNNRVCKLKSEWDADAIADAIAMDKFKTENTGRPIVSEPGSTPRRRP